jgi:hypothetical protein
MIAKATQAVKATGQAFCFKSRPQRQPFQGLILMDTRRHLRKGRRNPNNQPERRSELSKRDKIKLKLKTSRSSMLKNFSFKKELNSETQTKHQVDGYHLKHLTTKSLTQEHQKTG